MIKKIIISFLLILWLFVISNISYSAPCNYAWWSISSAIDWCLSDSKLVDASWDQSIEWNFKTKVFGWITKIAWFLWLIAIGAIVWWAFMMVISWGEEEKIKKAKDMIKWAVLWFLWIVLASSLIAIVVNFMYELW